MSVIILLCFFSIFKKGSSIIQPIELHPNDPSLAYPARISVDVEWTEALTSRYVALPYKNYNLIFFFYILKKKSKRDGFERYIGVFAFMLNLYKPLYPTIEIKTFFSSYSRFNVIFY